MECELRGRKIKLEENGDLYWFSPRGKLLKYKQTKTQITKRKRGATYLLTNYLLLVYFLYDTPIIP